MGDINTFIVLIVFIVFTVYIVSISYEGPKPACRHRWLLPIG